jgi:hypothetical protein
MSTPIQRPRPRALRPSPECLETRQLLSKTVTGTDIDGDTFTLKVLGPGDLRVVKANGTDGNPSPLNSRTPIAMIEFAGGNPETTRVVGHVTQVPGGDGKVFFKDFEEIGGRSLTLPAGNGVQTIDMPGFWLGNSTAVAPTPAGTPASQINIPDGVVTLRLGGVDATLNADQTNGTNASNPNTAVINLGLPRTTGTSIILDQSISGTRSVTPSGSTTPTTVQDGVLFNVLGRLNLFQANQVLGNAASAPSGFQGGGGTLVVSSPTDASGTTTGQIGFVHIGGDATNFSVQTNDKVSEFFIGGETNNIFLLAPAGSRNIHFGKGMDNVTIDTHTFENLQANRGALNSNVTVDRSAGRVVLGGDAVNTRILSGYHQPLLTDFTNQSAPTTPPNAQDGGGFTVLVAGDVTNSVFAASVQPLNNTFGTPNDLKLPSGHIVAKVQGTIDNSTATPASPTTAFYAQVVDLTRGPVIPPVVSEAPFPRQVFHKGQHGLTAFNPLNHPKAARSTTSTTSTGTTSTGAVRTAQAVAPVRASRAVPQGPAATSKKHGK